MNRIEELRQHLEALRHYANAAEINGHDDGPEDAPSQCVTGRVDRWQTHRVNDQTGTDFDPDWPAGRPATTVAGRDLIPHPGSNTNRFNDATKSRNDGMRVSPEEAGVLQSFRRDYPWHGSRTKVYEQIGNAVPPLLAAAVLSAATGLPRYPSSHDPRDQT